MVGSKWRDVDWLNGRINIERGVIRQVVDETKTESSRKSLAAPGELLDALKLWKAQTQFSGPDDWIFASPVKGGRLPYSYTGIKRKLVKVGASAGIGHVSAHTFRHSCRSWLDSLGTPAGVTQRMMRHASVTTTFDHYGDALPADVVEASEKVAGMAFRQAS